MVGIQVGALAPVPEETCPGAVYQIVSWRLWREKLSYVLLLDLKKAVSASSHLSSAGVCLCVHTSPFHKDIGPIEEDPILQTLPNHLYKDFSSKKKKKPFVFWGQDSKLSFLWGGGGSRFHLLAKESSRDDVALLKILLRGEHVGVGGGSASHFLWLPCVGEIELETKPPTARTASSQEQRRKKQFCYWTSTEIGCTNIVRKLLRRLQRQKEMLLPIDKQRHPTRFWRSTIPSPQVRGLPRAVCRVAVVNAPALGPSLSSPERFTNLVKGT